MMTRKTLMMAAALLTLTTGACSRSNDEPMPPENYSDMDENPANEPAVVTQAPLPEPTPAATADANMAAELPPETAPAPDEQMMDDASATGMTSRAARNEATPDDTGPVEQIEKK